MPPVGCGDGVTSPGESIYGVARLAPSGLEQAGLPCRCAGWGTHGTGGTTWRLWKALTWELGFCSRELLTVQNTAPGVVRGPGGEGAPATRPQATVGPELPVTGSTE